MSDSISLQRTGIVRILFRYKCVIILSSEIKSYLLINNNWLIINNLKKLAAKFSNIWLKYQQLMYKRID